MGRALCADGPVQARPAVPAPGTNGRLVGSGLCSLSATGHGSLVQACSANAHRLACRNPAFARSGALALVGRCPAGPVARRPGRGGLETPAGPTQFRHNHSGFTKPLGSAGTAGACRGLCGRNPGFALRERTGPSLARGQVVAGLHARPRHSPSPWPSACESIGFGGAASPGLAPALEDDAFTSMARRFESARPQGPDHFLEPTLARRLGPARHPGSAGQGGRPELAAWISGGCRMGSAAWCRRAGPARRPIDFGAEPKRRPT